MTTRKKKIIWMLLVLLVYLRSYFPVTRKAVKTKHQLGLGWFFCTTWTFRNSLNDVETLIFQSSFLIKYLKYFQAKVYYKTKERCSLLKRGSAVVEIFLWSSKILYKVCWNMFSELENVFTTLTYLHNFHINILKLEVEIRRSWIEL